ncbi:MAG: metallophosphoesterase [Bacteroidota bacterium]|jgi:serine/threonine protein phosphatase 1
MDNKSSLFIVSDIHGCYNTFLELLSKWDRDKEIFIQVGDLIDRGNFSPSVVKKCRELYDEGAIFLKGNHEHMACRFLKTSDMNVWFRNGGNKTYVQYKETKRPLSQDVVWFMNLPVKWENEHIHISHAGVSHTHNPYEENNTDGVLWTKNKLKNINKLQVVGHTFQKKGKPFHDKESNTLFIETGACYGKNLCAVRMDITGKILETILIPVHSADVSKT